MVFVVFIVQPKNIYRRMIKVLGHFISGLQPNFTKSSWGWMIRQPLWLQTKTHLLLSPHQGFLLSLAFRHFSEPSLSPPPLQKNILHFIVGLCLQRQGYIVFKIHYMEYISSLRDFGPQVINNNNNNNKVYLFIFI